MFFDIGFDWCLLQINGAPLYCGLGIRSHFTGLSVKANNMRKTFTALLLLNSIASSLAAPNQKCKFCRTLCATQFSNIFLLISLYQNYFIIKNNISDPSTYSVMETQRKLFELCRAPCNTYSLRSIADYEYCMVTCISDNQGHRRKRDTYYKPLVEMNQEKNMQQSGWEEGC